MKKRFSSFPDAPRRELTFKFPILNPARSELTEPQLEGDVKE